MLAREPELSRLIPFHDFPWGKFNCYLHDPTCLPYFLGFLICTSLSSHALPLTLAF